ncbi:hypothetical protein NNO_2150 [Hydrogenimonas sp.]|nr:hypothetical protein NNO_2150 [Hydrogenimonas sp.]
MEPKVTIVGFMFDKDTLKKYSSLTIAMGAVMVLIGVAGMVAPSIFSLAVVSFLAWLFLFSAIVQGYATYKSYRRSFSAWLKPLLSLVASVLLLVFPVEGVAAVGMLLAVYLLIDAYSSITFGWQYRPNRGWWMMIVNGLLSILLAAILLATWPVGSLVLVGLFVGISLFFDGVALIAFGLGARKLAAGDEKSENSHMESKK